MSSQYVRVTTTDNPPGVKPLLRAFQSVQERRMELDRVLVSAENMRLRVTGNMEVVGNTLVTIICVMRDMERQMQSLELRMRNYEKGIRRHDKQIVGIWEHTKMTMPSQVPREQLEAAKLPDDPTPLESK